MPAELFDSFMDVLGQESEGLLGWTEEERAQPKLKRKGYGDSLHEYFDEKTKKKKLHLPTRAMRVLVPFRAGHGTHTLSGRADLDWHERREQKTLKESILAEETKCELRTSARPVVLVHRSQLYR